MIIRGMTLRRALTTTWTSKAYGAELEHHGREGIVWLVSKFLKKLTCSAHRNLLAGKFIPNHLRRKPLHLFKLWTELQ